MVNFTPVVKQFYKLLCLIFIFCISFTNAVAQLADSLQCDTEEYSDSIMAEFPWHGNNMYLFELLDSLGYTEAYDPYEFPSSKMHIKMGNISHIPNVDVRIPVQFILHDNAQGIRGPQEQEMQFLIDHLSYFFSAGVHNIRGINRWNESAIPVLGQPSVLAGNDSRVLFYQTCSPLYRYNDMDAVLGSGEARRVGRDYRYFNCICVHIPNEYLGSAATTFDRLFGNSFIFMDAIAIDHFPNTPTTYFLRLLQNESAVRTCPFFHESIYLILGINVYFIIL